MEETEWGSLWLVGGGGIVWNKVSLNLILLQNAPPPGAYTGGCYGSYASLEKSNSVEALPPPARKIPVYAYARG